MSCLDRANGVRTADSAARVARGVPSRLRSQSGMAMVEFALVLPFMALFVLGGLQLAQVFIAQRQLLGAAATGARTGSAEGATTADVTAAISTFLGATSIGNSFTPTITGVSSSADENTTVTVTVTHNYQMMFRIPMIPKLNTATVPLSATVTVRHE